MTTFDSEYKELIRNYAEQTEHLYKEFSYDGGLDGPDELERRELFFAYKQKLKALRAKYGIEDSPAKIQVN
ncbi:MAG: hypothetical protein FWF85_07010 [Clostridiales bacterium]|nr:hypothetical protein [Clostridiales bacterium]